MALTIPPILLCAMVIIFIFCFMRYMTTKKEHFLHDTIRKSDITNIVNVTDTTNVIEDDYEQDEIDKYNNTFFSFGTRINNSSHLMDPVDNVNLINRSGKGLKGKSISAIYDKLTNAREYK